MPRQRHSGVRRGENRVRRAVLGADPALRGGKGGCEACVGVRFARRQSCGTRLADSPAGGARGALVEDQTWVMSDLHPAERRVMEAQRALAEFHGPDWPRPLHGSEPPAMTDAEKALWGELREAQEAVRDARSRGEIHPS